LLAGLQITLAYRNKEYALSSHGSTQNRRATILHEKVTKIEL